MARKWSTNELYRFQLTGQYPDWYEVETVPTKAETKAKTETKPKVNVQPTDKA